MARWWRAALAAGLLSGVVAAPARAAPAAASAFAEALLARVPVPSGATPDGTATARAGGVANVTGADLTGLVNATRNYWLAASFNAGAFIAHHWLPGSTGESTGDGGPGWSISGASADLTCANRHVEICGYFYNYGMVGGRQRLQVGAYATWRPIVDVTMPSIGVEVLTGYARTSLMNPSNHPASVTLTAAQRAAIAAAVAVLKDSAGGLCMEDSKLYTLTVRSSVSGAVLWRATADACPGALSITWAHHRAVLDARSCALDRAVAAALAPAAIATRRALALCA